MKQWLGSYKHIIYNSFSVLVFSKRLINHLKRRKVSAFNTVVWADCNRWHVALTFWIVDLLESSKLNEQCSLNIEHWTLNIQYTSSSTFICSFVDDMSYEHIGTQLHFLCLPFERKCQWFRPYLFLKSVFVSFYIICY